MEVGSCSSVEKMMRACSFMESLVAETVVAASKFLTCILLMTGPLLNDIDGSPKFTPIEKRFSLDELHKMKHREPDLKDASETEDDDDEDDDNAGDQDDDDDDADDEDFSGEEGEDEGDAEDDAEANGDGGSDDDDEDEDDDGDDDGDEEDEEEDEEEEDEETPQPPSKKRK